MYRIVCCRADKATIELDEQERIMTYRGLESFIIQSCTFDNESSTSRPEFCGTDSLDEVGSSCSSSKDGFGSFSSQWLVNRQEEQAREEWEVFNSPQHFYAKESGGYTMQFSDVDSMKERFAKLLLGEDVSGGSKGLATSLALSNAITNLAASVFGELWKLEPLHEERKSKWIREMDWLLSPTKYMVELVPARQNGANGKCMEIMTPRARVDIHMNLPALQKLDSMLIEILESMVNTEFWYAEGSSKGGEEGRSKSVKQSKRWWLPTPRVPANGLSSGARKKLAFQAKFVHQIFKAAKSINEHILMEMPVPQVTMDSIPKSGKANLGDDLYKAVNMESCSIEQIMHSLDLTTEHGALEMANRLEGAILAWNQRISEDKDEKSPVRNSWSFVRDLESEHERIEDCLQRANAILQQVKMRFPNLPQTFLGITKIQYNKDVGHSILEAYSRVLGNLAFSILARINDILKEDEGGTNKPDTDFFPGRIFAPISEISVHRVRCSLVDYMNKEGSSCSPDIYKASEEFPGNGIAVNVLNASARKSVSWCYGKESCRSVSPSNSP